MEYTSHLVWQGSTASGYRAYSREHRVVARPATSELRLSADAQFRGDPTLLNPEQLVVMAASSCQLLSFLAVAARAGIDVVDYEDEATGFMTADGDGRLSLTTIDLSAVITVAPGTDAGAVRRMVDEAHEECYIANSLRAKVRVDAEVVTA